MKDVKSQEKHKRTAEEWVEIARKFGEECAAIQHETKLDFDQKLKKQKSLSDQLAKEIREDQYLSDADKQGMLASIESYMADWVKMYEVIQKTSTSDADRSKGK